jgi:hypothetical protein
VQQVDPYRSEVSPVQSFFRRLYRRFQTVTFIGKPVFYPE